MKRMMTMILMAGWLLTACEESAMPDVQSSEPEISQTTDYDPFSRSDHDDAEDTNSTSVGYTHGVEWENGKELVLTDAATVSFRYCVENSGKATDFGLLLLINGIRQPYRTKEEPEDDILHTFHVEKNEKQTHTILFEPIIGEPGADLSVEIVTMYHPLCSSEEKDANHFAHRILSLFPSTLTVTEQRDCIAPTICSDYTHTTITEELRREFNQMDATGRFSGENALDKTVHLEALKNGVFLTPKDYLNGKQDMTPFSMQDSISLCLYGGREPCKYRVSMYFNHAQVKGAFDGADYIDMICSRDEICMKEIDLRALDLPFDDENQFYFIAVPFYQNHNYGERMVMKSETAILK